ncbi:MAG TPA: EAL domain-containing protein [Steroidobacteraceae bacterium]
MQRRGGPSHQRSRRRQRSRQHDDAKGHLHLQDREIARQELRALGVRIALDNFGTGYSSLYHLRNVKLDKIKIDRRFVDHLGLEFDGTMVISARVGLGQGLGLTIENPTLRARTGCLQY